MSSQTTKQQIRSKIRWGIAGIFALLLIAVGYDAPVFVNRAIDAANRALPLGLPHIPAQGFALGLDLQGGAQLIYEADTSGIASADHGSAVEGVRDVIERRVNALGVGEPNVQTSKVDNAYRVIVELPGVTDIAAAIAKIGETPTLEFREENDTPARELNKEEKKELDTFNADQKKLAGEVLQKSKKGESFGALATQYSEDTVTKNSEGYVGFVSSKTVEPAIMEWLKTAEENAVSGVIETEQSFLLLRRGASQDGDPEIQASHILICYLGSRNCDNPQFTKQEALVQAEKIYAQANAENFGTLAREHSSDRTVETNSGDLGFFGRGEMMLAFENAVFGAAVGDIIGPVETEFGYHIIYKTNEQPTKEYELSKIVFDKKIAIDILPAQDPWKPSGLSGKQLERTEVVSDPTTGEIQVSLQFNSEGTELFRAITERNLNKPVAIFLDGGPISIPTVTQVIPDGRAVIRGNFTLDDARLLSQRLNAGALPVPVSLVSQQTVGASLGAASLVESLKAGIIGVLVVMLFMLLFYRLPGAISVIALALYVALTLALFKVVGVTLTLAGIAGFILSIGMAVDANVLIFERMKEELKDGKSLKAAVEEGFLRAWTSIRDGNVSTLITCGFLLFFGSGFVKGFALTLSIGILASMFTAITVTRILLRFIVPWFSAHGGVLFLGSKK